MNIINIFKNTNGNLGLFLYLLVFIFILGRRLGYKIVINKFLLIVVILNLFNLL